MMATRSDSNLMQDWNSEPFEWLMVDSKVMEAREMGCKVLEGLQSNQKVLVILDDYTKFYGINEVVEKEEWKNIVIAYTPPNTRPLETPLRGHSCVTRKVRYELARCIGPRYANSVKIIYGGRVKEGHAVRLLAENWVDGFLVNTSTFTDEIAQLEETFTKNVEAKSAS